MLNQERRNAIVAQLSQKRVIKNSELMEQFHISIETVRRDLAWLEQQGYLRRVYGGAEIRRSKIGEPEYANRLQKNLEQKTAISASAAELIEENDTIFFDQGTTVQLMAEHLSNSPQFTAFTIALRTAIALIETGYCKVIVPGGNLRPKEYALSGYMTESTLRDYNFDKAFFGLSGLTADGMTDYHIEESNLRRHIIHNAGKVIVLTDSSKFGMRASSNVCALDDIDILITDSGIPDSYVRLLEDAGVQIIIADPAYPEHH